LTSLNASTGTAAAADFLKAIENSSGLIIEDQYGKYTFSHRTFREYLAATYLCNRGMPELAAHVVVTGGMKRSDFLLLNLTPRRYWRRVWRKIRQSWQRLRLAVECLEEAQTVDEIWRKRVERVVACEVDDADRQKVYGEALLRLRLRRMVPLILGAA